MTSALGFIFPLIALSCISGCAEKRAPDDELIREYLYAIKPVELWHTERKDYTSLDDLTKIVDEKFLRKFMRVSEMDEAKFMPICVNVAAKAVQDAGFFMNNSKGRKSFEDLAALRAKSPVEYEKLIKERCKDSLLMIKGRAKVRENKRRQNISTDTP